MAAEKEIMSAMLQPILHRHRVWGSPRFLPKMRIAGCFSLPFLMM